MRLIDSLRGQRSIATLEDYAQALTSFGFGGHQYGLAGGLVQQTMKGTPIEALPNHFPSYAQAYQSNGIIFACMLARQDVFSSVQFAFQRKGANGPSELWTSGLLAPLEEPYVGGTTQDLLTRMIVDADLAGNAYHVRDRGEILRLRPDWVTLLLSRNPRTGTFQKDAYIYDEDGPGTNKEPRIFFPEQISHFAPIPDPLATFRGMSRLTPVVREVQHDNQLNRHKQKFLENAATPNVAVVLDKEVDPAKFERFRELFKKHHRGPENAGETMFLGGGADVTLIGQNYKQMDLKGVQGAGETRIAAAFGVPPIIVGLSEGLAAATYSNYGQARRAFGDRTMHPLWANAAGSLARIVPAPTDSRLWYDARHVAFLREDAKDAAEVAFTEAQTMRQLIEAGFTPESAQKAVAAGDYSMLKHSGLVSVQLQLPGATQPTTPPNKEAQ